MRNSIAVGTSLALVLLVGCLRAGDTIKSGPQEGESLPGPFHPLNVTGDGAGNKVCQV
jgi:hypothetical protein